MYNKDPDVPIDAWLSRFESWFQIEAINDPNIQARYVIDNIDFKLWRDVADYSNLPYAQLKSKLILLFKRPEQGSIYMADYMTLSQRESESPVEFMDRIRMTPAEQNRIWTLPNWKRHLLIVMFKVPVITVFGNGLCLK